MLLGKHITVVMPAYNAASTLEQTLRELPRDIVDRIILVDDASKDKTVEVAQALPIDEVIVHDRNLGYGGNQKTCYDQALSFATDIVVMLHPDYQYSPRLVAAMAAMVASDHYDLVLGSRIISESALRGGMPVYKYISNRILTFLQNLALGLKLSEYHTGFRAYSRQLLETLDYHKYSDNFIFDNELLVDAHRHKFKIGEISCPAKYFAEASSISFWPSVRYGLGVLQQSASYLGRKLFL